MHSIIFYFISFCWGTPNWGGGRNLWGKRGKKPFWEGISLPKPQQPPLIGKLTLTELTTTVYYSNQCLYKGKGTWDKTYKPSYTRGIAAIPSPILSGLHLQDPRFGCEGSHVRNQDKTSWFLFLLLSFVHPSLPSHIKPHSTLGLISLKNWLSFLKHLIVTYSSWYSKCCTPLDLTTWYSDGTRVSGTPTLCYQQKQ